MPSWWSRRWVRWLREGLLIAIVVAGVQIWQSWGAASGVAPSLVGPNLVGETVDVRPSEGGLAVHFWATWCGVCKAEEGNVRSLAEDARVVTVATRSGPSSEVAAYRESHPVEGPTLLDTDGSLAARWGVRSFPTTFFINREGEITGVSVGYTTWLGMWLRAWWAGAV